MRIVKVLCLVGFMQIHVSAQVDIQKEKLPPPPKVLNIATRYAASGGLGDATNGTRFVQLNLVSQDNPRPGKKECIKVNFTPGPARWAGTYWLNKPDNWGDKPGDDLSKANYSKITFWIRGEKGNEKVEFKAGGIDDAKKSYKDSFELTTGMIELRKDWRREEITLQGQNLSGVIGLFCWVANCDANPSGVTFYMDEIRYE